MNHYFTRRPAAPSQPREIRVRLRGRPWRFLTDRGVFAREAIDPGMRLLIETMQIAPTDDVLDLGCGYGAIGLIAAHLAPRGRTVLIDVNERAVALAAENARRLAVQNVEISQGDGTAGVRGDRFDLVVMNPPIRAGRTTVIRLVQEIHEILRPGGRFYFVARTAQGAKTLARAVETVFEGVHEVERRSGYRVYLATKPPDSARDHPQGVRHSV